MDAGGWRSKESLASVTILFHPADAAELRLICDASNFAIGAVFEQRLNDSWKPLAFCSRKLSPAQQNYNAYDREAVKYFCYFLEGRIFKIITSSHLSDHATFGKDITALTETAVVYLTVTNRVLIDIFNTTIWILEVMARKDNLSETILNLLEELN